MVERGTEAGPRVLGLTGPIGCGKTTAGDLLLELGAIERIDADRVVHELMAPGTEVTARIREAFGSEAIAGDGSVDRRRLGAIVFDDPAALRRLEGITHPAVRQEIRARLARLRGREGVVVIDAVKLLQSELLPLASAVWVITCNPRVQSDRLRQTRGMTAEAVRARLAAMPSFSHPRVTVVLDNSGSPEEFRAAVRTAWEQLARDWHPNSPA